MINNVKIAYIGGGSKMWARIFMNDLAIENEFTGTVSLYDIDIEAAKRNQKYALILNESPKALNKWHYEVASSLKEALIGANFVVISILPGTLNEMMVDVHAPEKYGIYQTVGDSIGPGGILRAMRSVPLFEGFAKAIKKYAKNAWVDQLTNPMTILTNTLFDTFKGVKAYGCCHEVFHAQEFLAMVLEEELNLGFRPKRSEIMTDVSGINHFTFISSAYYMNDKQKIDLFSLLPSFIKKHYDEGIYEGNDPKQFLYDSYAYGNKVKMDLFNRYQVLGAAGDRHLVEFMPGAWYLKDPTTIDYWRIKITPVASRIEKEKAQIKDTIDVISGLKKVDITPSNEEGIQIMEALLGVKDLKTNVNYLNKGQIKGYPVGVVETNALFSKDKITPIASKPLPYAVNNLILRDLNEDLALLEAIKRRDIKAVFQIFVNDPLVERLSIEEAKALFKTMVVGTKKYLEPYYNLDDLEDI